MLREKTTHQWKGFIFLLCFPSFLSRWFVFIEPVYANPRAAVYTMHGLVTRMGSLMMQTGFAYVVATRTSGVIRTKRLRTCTKMHVRGGVIEKIIASICIEFRTDGHWQRLRPGSRRYNSKPRATHVAALIGVHWPSTIWYRIITAVSKRILPYSSWFQIFYSMHIHVGPSHIFIRPVSEFDSNIL